MTKIFRTLIFAAALLLCAGASASPAFAAPRTEAEGGRMRFEFTQDTFAEIFEVYTETLGDTPFFVRDGFLYSTGRAENKALVKSPAELSSFTISADFYPLDDICPLDAGFYIYAQDAGNGIDAIRGYNVNLERDVREREAVVKIHRFDYGWLGAIAETRVPLKRLPVSLKVEADEGYVRVFLFDGGNPVLEVALPDWSAGQVGFRTFRGRGAKIGNFRLTAAPIPTDTDELEQLIARANAIDAAAFTGSSVAALQTALSAAEQALFAGQTEVDTAEKRLSEALEGLLPRRTFAQLAETIANAERIVSEGNGEYTQNSFGSLKSVLLRARALTDGAGEERISAMTGLLELTIGRLIRYRPIEKIYAEIPIRN